MTDKLEFPSNERWNGGNDTVEFLAVFEGHKISCAITLEALQDDFGGDHTEPLECFRKSRKVIEQKAANLIKRRQVSKDNSVVIRSGSG